MSGRDHAPPARILGELELDLGGDTSIQRILDHLVERIVEVLPVTGAGVMLMDARQKLHFVAASDEALSVIEDLQNELQEGPCLEAHRTGHTIMIGDLCHDTRFSSFSPRACAEGLGAMFVFPMALDDDRLGALDLYRDAPGALSDEDQQTAQVLADVAAAYLVNAQARIDASATVARLSHLNLHDPLTGLPNRTLLEELLEQALARTRRTHLITAVIFADLDGFKAVNDRHGHHAGDELLGAVADRLSQAIRPGDTVARLGGDEFVVVCEDLPAEAEAESVAHRLSEVLTTPFDLSGSQRVTVSASLGIAFAGGTGPDTPDSLLRDADFAMYQAKNHGGGRHQRIDLAARFAAERRTALEMDLRHATSRGELAVVYQPIVDIRSGSVAAVEALVRWQHPVHGEVTPDVIIPSAERTGMILTLGEWVLRQACLDLASWPAEAAVPRVAVNVSAQQVVNPAFLQTVERVLGDTGVDPRAVGLEVTESVLLADGARAHEVLRHVKDLGVRLSLDDFGTGYSSLNYLRQFPFDDVKIDRSFTAAVADDPPTRSIVRAMVDLGHVLDLTVTAEGVETPRQLVQVTQLGADHAQGFHLGRPLAPHELLHHLRGTDAVLTPGSRFG